VLLGCQVQGCSLSFAIPSPLHVLKIPNFTALR
jgi:hypothetical protein